MISKKIVLVGDFATGKTSLIRRFVDDQFNDSYLSTIGVKISKKVIDLGHTQVRGLIWDIEGGTTTKPVNTTYFSGAHGCILVADIGREETIAHIADYIELIRSNASDAPLIIVLNKSDMHPEDIRFRVLEETKSLYGDRIDTILLSSAKTGEGVEEMFLAIAKKMVG